MSRISTSRFSLAKLAVLVGAVSVAMMTIMTALARLALWNVPWPLSEVLSLGMSFSLVLLAAAVIFGALAFVREGFPSRRGDGGPGVDAIEIARRRYARGEIGQEEFQRLRDDLQARG